MEYLPAELEILNLMPQDIGLSGWNGENCPGEGGGILPDTCEDDDWGGM